MAMTMTERKSNMNKTGSWKSLFKDRSVRQMTETLNQTVNSELNRSLKKNKNTQSLNTLLINPLKMNKLKQL